MSKKIIKRIHVNWNSLDSIRKAEKQKLRLENKGFTLIHTDSSFNSATMTYSK